MGSNTKPGESARLLARPCARALLSACLLLAVVALPAAALADATPLEGSTELPWADPAHQSPLELLASRIASQIAGRTVTVRCEAPAAWSALVQANGGDPSAEAGFVATSWNTDTGALVSAASVAELNGASICLPLQLFAEAASKPTKCRAAAALQPAAAPEKGRLARAVHRSAASASSRLAQPLLPPGPCYLAGGKSAAQMPASFWSSYASFAEAILTLAHESIHLGGVVGGRLVNGLAVGDQQAEAKANCYGMQWMPYVAEQLGDSADDAQAIADYYYWSAIYPLAKSSAEPQYWSAACVRGGALDLGLARSPLWP